MGSLVSKFRAHLAVCTAVVFVSIASVASAVPQYDLSPVTTGIVEQIQASLVVILPIAGGILALFVAWRIIKRMVKA